MDTPHDPFGYLGPVGAWSGRLQRRPTGQAIEMCEELGELGYQTVWVPESPSGKNVLTFAAVLLGGTSHVNVATGIAITWVRDAVAMINASRTLGDAYPGRFVLGVGISHQSTAEGRGHLYEKPLNAMRTYLDTMRDAAFDGGALEWTPPTIVAALGPKMLAVSGAYADGAHSFLTTPEHTAGAREVLGADKLLAVEQGVVLLDGGLDAREGRDRARVNLLRFLAWPNYRNHLKRLGFNDADFEGKCSDRLIDALYVIGDEEAVGRRIGAHRDAGADHVCLQVIGGSDDDELEAFRRLAPQTQSGT
jgi:probable F420-dependent oxidoreductase